MIKGDAGKQAISGQQRLNGAGKREINRDLQ